MVFNVSGGQNVVRECRGRVQCGVVRPGSIAIVDPSETSRISFSGAADTVQFVVSNPLITQMRADEPRDRNVAAPALQGDAAQALVAFAAGGDSEPELEQVARSVAATLAWRKDAPDREQRGGLSARSRQQVLAAIEDHNSDAGQT